jgi:hypothetical protein
MLILSAETVCILHSHTHQRFRNSSTTSTTSLIPVRTPARPPWSEFQLATDRHAQRTHSLARTQFSIHSNWLPLLASTSLQQTPASPPVPHKLHSRCLHLSSFCTVVLPSFSPCKKSSNNVVDVTVSNCEDVQGCARMCKDVCKTHCQSWRSCSLAFQGKNSVSLMMSVCLCLLWKHLRLCRLFSLRFVMV